MKIKEVQTGYVNLSEIDGLNHQELFHAVAKEVAADNLAFVNENDKSVTPKNSIYARYIKRLLDIVISAIALLITLPINLVLAIVTYFDVGRPIIFRQKRIGKDGKKFTIIKFRNMTNDTNEEGELLPPNQRVTKWGGFVRRTSLDELLNFYNVLKGDMSLIGPRPLAIEYEERYSERHKMRYAIRPGLECPNIISKGGKYKWSDQFENDIYYVENISFLLDVKMLLALIGMVFNRKSNAVRGNAVRGSFIGYYKNGESINSRRVPLHYVMDALEKHMGESVSNNTVRHEKE